LVGVLSLFGKNPLSFREIDFSNVEFDEFWWQLRDLVKKLM
jgi:hypothetical protein